MKTDRIRYVDTLKSERMSRTQECLRDYNGKTMLYKDKEDSRVKVHVQCVQRQRNYESLMYLHLKYIKKELTVHYKADMLCHNMQ